LQSKLLELQQEPDFQWGATRINYATDEDGSPAVRVALANVSLDYDLWAGLRNPALVGLHPAGLREVWEFHACRTTTRVDEAGRQTIFQIPRSFEVAQRGFGRAVIISAMLPFSPEVIEQYVEVIRERGNPPAIVRRMYLDVEQLLDRATARAAMYLVNDERAVVAMDAPTIERLSKEAIPPTRQGDAHGPSKGGNFPLKSVGVLTGLGQFGIGRFVIRDEMLDGRARRLIGSLRSIIVFDRDAPVTDGRDGIVFPTQAWRDFLFQLYDFTNTDAEVNRFRYCAYVPKDGTSCRRCLAVCEWGALEDSVPTPQGNYTDRVQEQQHRFWNGKLQFDYARCCRERQQMQSLFPEWDCQRCLTVCANEGLLRPEAVHLFQSKKRELTRAVGK
jgi:hypothetical protein